MTQIEIIRKKKGRNYAWSKFDISSGRLGDSTAGKGKCTGEAERDLSGTSGCHQCGGGPGSPDGESNAGER